MSKLLFEKPITMSEVKEILETVKNRNKDAVQGFRAQRTEEYIAVFAKLSVKDVEALKKDIKDLSVPRLSEEHVVKICDLLPETGEEVKVILQGYAVTVTKENLQKIADCVKKVV